MKDGTSSRYLGLLAALAIAFLIWSGPNQDQPQANAAAAVPMELGSGGFVAHVLESEGRPPRVIFIDGQRRVLAVYEIGREKGEVKFVSSRNLSYDLQMMGFNTAKPLPEEIKKQLQAN